LPNPNYERGRAAEYRVRRQLESEGWLCVRAAGSKGPVDIVAFRDGRVRCIQVKTGTATVSPAERDALLRLKAILPADATVEIWRGAGKRSSKEAL